MRTFTRCWIRADVSRYGVICTGTGCRIERANTPRKSLAVPDVSGFVRGDQMWLCGCDCMFHDRDRSRRCRRKASNLPYPCSVLSEPDVPPRIPGDTVGIAVRRWNRILEEFVCLRVEEANFVCVELGEPEISICIEGQVIGDTAFLQWPLAPVCVLRMKFSDSITVGLGEPDIAIRIYCNEEGARVSRRLREVLN